MKVLSLKSLLVFLGSYIVADAALHGLRLPYDELAALVLALGFTYWWAARRPRTPRPPDGPQ